MVLGILAHVDAGKTTLSEALLYKSGKIDTLGRVDNKNAYLDTDTQERERGITIFSKQAQLDYKGLHISLLDTPGHVDFSAEMERTLQVLDYAILVISGTDGVQGHTKTLWKLLNHYQIPAFIFVNKMDLAAADKVQIQKQMQTKLSDRCIDFTEMDEEEIAVCSEKLLDYYMEHECISDELIASAIAKREIYPCFYGSALKLQGVEDLLEHMKAYAKGTYEPAKEEMLISDEKFGGIVYKIGRDMHGVRLSYLKVTSGQLKVKDKISYQGIEEKIDQIRIYSGEKYETVMVAKKGEVCAVTGLSQTFSGMGLGVDKTKSLPVLEPVLSYRLILPPEVNPMEFMKNLRRLEEEDPQLNIVWKESVKEIHVQLMGQIQMEVLERTILERFGVRVAFDSGAIMYKETIAKPIEGVGHFEPLRHYAEVHIWIEPAEPNTGISVCANCSGDVLDFNWQKLIMTHILECEHLGVLTGSPITDVKFTVVTGRANIKHTEGGDFRQATYRAIRQGLKATESILLEPYYRFTLELPVDMVGRAMTDIENRFGKQENLEYLSKEDGDIAILTGTAPVSTMHDYVTQVHAYTKGMGHLTLELQGYDVCHNSLEVIERMGYDSEEDVEHPTGSVFCAYGSGFYVPWNEVADYMHLPYVCEGKELAVQTEGLSYDLGQQAEALRELAKKRELEQKAKSISSWELDKELQQIYAREFGMNKENMLDEERKKWNKKTPSHQKLDKKGNPIYPKPNNRKPFLIVDGYNIIFALPELKELANLNIDSAKDKLKDMLADYQGYKGCRMMVVFDGYKKKGNKGSEETYFDLEVVHTKQDETADAYIEKTVHKLSDKFSITVVTNDGLEQLTILSQGGLRMSAKMLMEDMERVKKTGVLRL